MKKIILSKCFLHVVLLTLAFCLFPVLPAFAQEDIVNRLDKALGVTLPSEYKSKVKAFVQGSKVLEGLGVIPTEKFIKEQMKEDWGINKQNQLLFIWDAIYEQITKKNFYDGEDGNKQRLDDFENALDKIEACGKKYKQDYKAYMEQQSAEAKQQSAEARQQSAEARQNRIMIAYYGLYQITSCYQLRDYAPESEIKDETWFWKDLKEYEKHVVNNCEEFNIDYRSLLPLEVQKFYGIQPTRQNNLTCEKAMVQILTCTLKELARLYNLFQLAPQAESEIKSKMKNENYYFEDCKKNNVDYKAILRKELGDEQKVKDLMKFYGAE